MRLVDLIARRVLRHVPEIQRCLLSFGVHDNDVEDAAQEVVIVVWRAAVKGNVDWSTPAVLRAYAWGVAWRTASRHRAKTRSDAGTPQEVPAVNPLPRLEARDELRRIRRSTTREELDLLTAIANGATTADIAAARGVPIGTVATWVRRLRKRLR